MSRRSSLVLAGLLVLALVTLGGTAFSAAKITSKQIAKNAIHAKQLKAGAVTADKIGAGAVTGDKIPAGAVTGAKLAPNTVTGAQVDEATLGRVPDAAAVAGATVTPIAIALPDTTPTAVVVAAGNGWTVRVHCDGVEAYVYTNKTSAALLTVSAILTPSDTTLTVYPLGSTTVTSLHRTAIDYTMMAYAGGAGSSVVQLHAIHSTNVFGGTDDCLFRGTLTGTP